MDPITKAYLTMLEESDKSSGIVGSTKSQVGKIFGDETSLPDSDCTTDNVDLETPEEAPAELTSKGATGEPKPMKKTKNESLNPFDALYNRVLNEEGEFDFSTEDNSLEPSDEGVGGESDSEMGEESDESEESDEVTLTIDRETAQKLVDILTSVLGEGEQGEEEEQTEDEMFDDSDSESGVEDLESSNEDEDPFKESVDAEELGHALVKDLDKGHLTGKKTKEVKGAVPVSKKSAQSSTIKGADGKIEKHSTEGAISKLTGKNNNVGGVKVGKGLFDQ